MILLFFDKTEVEQDEDTENYSIPSERLEIVLFDEVHDELDNEHGNEESNYHSNEENSQFASCKVKAEFHQFEKACAEHNRYCKEECELSGNRSCDADKERTDDSRT